MCDRNEMGFVQKLAMPGNENFQDEMKMPFFSFSSVECVNNKGSERNIKCVWF